jgi:hypothetical protein
MDEFVAAFTEPVGVYGGKGLDDREPPDLSTDYAARLVALLVEDLGGTVAIPRPDLRAVPDRLVLLVREGEEMLELQTRPLGR